MTLTGMRSAPVQTAGGFTLRRQGPLEGLVLPRTSSPTTPRAALARAAGLDTAACDGLGDRLRDRRHPRRAGARLRRLRGRQLQPRRHDGLRRRHPRGRLQPPGPVLAALHGATTSSRRRDRGRGTTVHASPRPTGRRGLPRHRRDAVRGRADPARQRGDRPARGERRSGSLAANFAADEAQRRRPPVDRGPGGRRVRLQGRTRRAAPDALSRELAILAADRERLAAALAPTLAPAYTAGLEWLEEHPEPAARAPTSRPQLAADYARTTAQWARVAHRAGKNPDDVRAASTSRPSPCTPPSAELHARLADNPDASVGLHALGPALRRCSRPRRARPELHPFGYPPRTSRSRSAPRTSPTAAATSRPSRRSPPTRSRSSPARRRRLAAGPRLRAEDPHARRHRPADRDRVQRQAARPVRQPPRRDRARPRGLRRARRPHRRPPRRRRRRRPAHPPRRAGQREQPARDRRGGGALRQGGRDRTSASPPRSRPPTARSSRSNKDGEQSARGASRPRPWPSAPHPRERAAPSPTRSRRAATSSTCAAPLRCPSIFGFQLPDVAGDGGDQRGLRQQAAQPRDRRRQPVRERAKGQAGLQNELDRAAARRGPGDHGGQRRDRPGDPRQRPRDPARRLGRPRQKHPRRGPAARDRGRGGPADAPHRRGRHVEHLPWRSPRSPSRRPARSA
jgi:hypothetical protein